TARLPATTGSWPAASTPLPSRRAPTSTSSGTTASRRCTPWPTWSGRWKPWRPPPAAPPAARRLSSEGERAERREGIVAEPEPVKWGALGEGYLPGLLGLEIREVERGRVTSRLPVRRELLAPNGYLHAASVVALADTSCGYGTVASLPEGGRGFTTIEL